jgi:hypothetical protein
MLAAIAALSVAFIALFFYIAMRRMHFPLQLEWLEGGVLDTTVRVLHHQAIYVQPTYRFVPNIYTPLYFYLGAAALKLFGISLATLRLFSTLCTAGCLCLLALQTRLIGRSWLAGLASAGFFAALYGSIDGWYDLARIDMLFLLLTLIAILLSYKGYAVLAALTFVLAYQTKQAAAFIAVFVLLHEIEKPRRIILGLGTFFAGLLASIFYLDHQSHGWYDYYTLHLPAGHSLVPLELIAFFTRGLLNHVGLALAVILLGIFSTEWRPAHRRLAYFLFATTTGTFLSALSGRIHSGGSVNVALPLYAWIAVLFGVAIAAVLRQLAEMTAQSMGANNAWLNLIVLTMGAMQLGALVYPLDKLLPTRLATQEAQAAFDTIARQPGDIYVVGNTIDLAPAGKQSFANSVAVYDIVRGDHGPVAEALKADLDAAMQQHRFAAVVSPGALDRGFLYDGSPAQLGSAYNGKEETILSPAASAELEKIIPPSIAPSEIHLAR